MELIIGIYILEYIIRPIYIVNSTVAVIIDYAKVVTRSMKCLRFSVRN